MASARTRLHLRQLAAIILVVSTIAPVFNVLTSRASLGAALQGVIDAVLISLLVGGYFAFLRDGWARPWFQRLSFRQDLALSSAIALVLYLVGRAAGQVVMTRDPRRFLLSFTDTHLAFALPFFAVVAVGVQLAIQMNRIIGTDVLRYFIAGVYHRPRMEQRLFLFMDLTGSTQLAERLGSARYFDLLRRFVDDLTAAVIETEGEIYQYAGDEVVVTWPVARGLRGANCIRCFFEIRAAVVRNRARYEADFALVPTFRGGLHGGAVTAGELGDLRRQIVFVGDILNTAARLEEYAKRTGFDLVVSGVVLGQVALPPGIVATPCGELALRGKEASVAAYGLTGP